MRKSRILGIAALLMLAAPMHAQEEEREELRQESVVVTGMRVTQGGAQDIDSFRGSIEDGEMIPPPGALTAEGLLSEYDLTLAESAPCDQLFCLSAESMPADFIGLPDATSVIALGFGTNLDATTWQRDPLTLIAVVDKSGSMSGTPLETAKHAMQLALSQLREGDRMGVVQYGSQPSILIPVMDAAQNRESLSSAIAGIQSGGATAMENGLRLAFDTAREVQPNFDGRTRVMLFTDERPNVGRTDKDSFIDMAKAASMDGIGLTTIGVSDYFGAELANQVAAARGGNLFFMRNKEEADALFDDEFDFLVTELAHDLKIKITPTGGAAVENVYGVPGEALERARDGSFIVTVPSVFLSSKSGALVAVLDGDALSANVSLSYIGADKTLGADEIQVAEYSETPSAGLKKASLLIDEYVLLHTASEKFYQGGDIEGVKADLNLFGERLATIAGDELQQEIELVNAVVKNLAEPPPHVRLHGQWTVKRVRDRAATNSTKTTIDIRRNDRIAIDVSEDGDAEWELERLSARGDEDEFEHEYIGLNEEQIYLEHSDILFTYRFVKDRLQLRVHDTDLYLTLERTGRGES